MAFERNQGLANYLKDIKNYSLLTAEQEKELTIRYQRGGDKAARNQLVAANLRLVVMAAKHYTAKSSLSFEDLIQEGNLGLVRAIDTYDVTTGWRFSTYAMHWIKQAISRAILNQSKVIRIPAHMVDLKSKYTKAQSELFTALGREATAAEIADFMKIETKKVKEVAELIKDPLSLSTSLNDEDDGTLEDLVADTSIQDPDAAMDNARLAETFTQLLETLTDRERAVIIARFGLNGTKPQTLEEVGKSFNLSKERIRQLEQTALHKLRNPRRLTALKAYL